MNIDLSDEITTEHRAGRMLAGLVDATSNRKAKVVLTCELSGSKTYHQTFVLRSWENDKAETIVTVEVKGSGDYAAGVRPIKVMHVNVSQRSIFEARDERNRDALLIYAAHAALMFAWRNEVPTPTNGTVEVHEEAVCGMCGLELTDPESIERGIGPTCYGKATGRKTITGRKGRQGELLTAAQL